MRRVKTGERTFHVFNRGARRLTLFYEPEDFRMFLELLFQALQHSGCLLYAYCLMTNHYHLILKGTSDQLSLCMRLVDWKYAVYHNIRHRLGGHVFEGPYKAYRQKTILSIFWKIAYVFLNPVLAGLTRGPGEYAWSGYKSFLGLPGSPLGVSIPEELCHLGPNREQALREFSQIMADQGERLRAKPRRADEPTAIECYQDQFEWLRKRAHARIDHCLGERPTVVAMHWAQDAGIPPRAMARSLGEPDVKKIYNLLAKFRAKLKSDPVLAAQLGTP